MYANFRQKVPIKPRRGSGVRRLFRLAIACLLFLPPGLLLSQTALPGNEIYTPPAWPNYDMNFSYRNSNGVYVQTHIARSKFMVWGKSADFPVYMQWQNQPFAVRRSPIEGLGLFTDSVSSFKAGDIIGYAFFKIGSAGSFWQQYKESNIGSFVNDSRTPNTKVVLTPKGVLMIALVDIGPNTELTGNYDELLKLFPWAGSLRREVEY